MANFVKLTDQLFINVEAVEAIRQQADAVGLQMMSGQVYRLDGATAVSLCADLFLTGLTDDVLTTVVPQSLWQSLLSYFRR